MQANQTCIFKYKFWPRDKGKTNTKDIEEFVSELLSYAAGRNGSGLLS